MAKAKEKEQAAELSSARRSEYSTTYEDLDGKTVHAARHDPCKGKGCADCKGLGFTTS